ncbi:hypothetical protein THASP1DRAFT_28937 [Thamnocephalis sphaerospora]|uniref:Uncharacterized protein n=1 Tax=Thamnocephalis sphaerospora TaxID=78915 RepID=A0A4V1IWZ3_9FUNG|nr:hypothetical protein THASP1DRAFT_28937 [Thamnocephalis sphaerospora]|eukprot:RKP09259.1 hypothetical protein THASP1DRAFT_28937 [Thamnocephalis sphaerospora]
MKTIFCACVFLATGVFALPLFDSNTSILKELLGRFTNQGKDSNANGPPKVPKKGELTEEQIREQERAEEIYRAITQGHLPMKTLLNSNLASMNMKNSLIDELLPKLGRRSNDYADYLESEHDDTKCADGDNLDDHERDFESEDEYDQSKENDFRDDSEAKSDGVNTVENCVEWEVAGEGAFGQRVCKSSSQSAFAESFNPNFPFVGRR